MNFKNAAAIENLVWQMRLADWPRARNRALINATADGVPPYTAEEVTQNNINFNVNFLELTKITHDARRQFYTGMVSPDPRFTVNVDYGPIYRKQAWSSIITKKLNKLIRGSNQYTQTLRSVFALNVLHGIGPSYWDGPHMWRPKPLGVEDVLIPSGTYLEMDNLPFFAIYRQFTGNELRKMTNGPMVDPGWNMPLVNQAIKWVDQQASALLGQTWPEVWSPDKWEQREKEDSGLYSSDKCPTIDCFDFYWWSDEKKNAGWKRRIVLDAWGSPGMGGAGGVAYQSNRKFEHGKGEFLYTSKDRNYAEKLEQIVHFQFADASSVAPFRYHSVRSLGFLLYSVCQLQNRLRCKFTEGAFESMMQYLRSSNPDDAERALSVNLIDKRVLPQGIEFVKEGDRWSIPQALVESVLQLNRQSMADNSGSFTQDFDFAEESTRDETATRTMAKVNSTAAMVGAMLQQAYDQQHSAYLEICRRFCMPNSRDKDVREFRVSVLDEGVPPEALEFQRWDIQLQRVIGGGNKQMQSGMMNQAMAVYDKLNPEAQQKVLRMWLSINLDDYALAQDLVPDQKHVSDSVHDAQQSVGTIMSGAQVSPKPGLNNIEIIETWLHGLASIMDGIEKEGGTTTEDEYRGLVNFEQHIAARIQLLAQDKTMKQKVKQYGDDLGNLANLIKAYGQRLAEAKQQQNGQAQQDPKDLAKAQATMQMAQVKNQLAQQKFTQKSAQDSIKFEQKVKQSATEHRAKVAAIDLTAASDIKRNGKKSPFKE